MKKSEKITPINSITISIGRDHRKLGGHKYDMRVVTKATWGGHIKDMLIDGFHEQILKIYQI